MFVYANVSLLWGRICLYMLNFSPITFDWIMPMMVLTMLPPCITFSFPPLRAHMFVYAQVSLVWVLSIHHEYSSWIIVIHHESSLFIMNHQYSSWILIIHHGSSLFVMNPYYSSWILMIHNDSSLFVMNPDYSSWILIIHYESLLLQSIAPS